MGGMGGVGVGRGGRDKKGHVYLMIGRGSKRVHNGSKELDEPLRSAVSSVAAEGDSTRYLRFFSD